MKKIKLECLECKQEVTSNTIKMHYKHRHKQIFDTIENSYASNKKECPTCKKYFHNITFGQFLLYVLGFKQIFKHKKFCSSECVVSWNKNLKKEDDIRLKKISDSKKGINNPIHSILSNEEKLKNFKESLKEARKHMKSFKGKSLIERYGEEKALSIKQKQSESAKQASILYKSTRGMINKNHTPETKEKIRQKTLNQLTNTFFKTSKIQKDFYFILKEQLPNEEIFLEYKEEYYSIDIAIPKIKLAIEIDGDFWHVNEQAGYSLKYASQKKNLTNDKIKNDFLIKNGWTIIRLWEADIKADNKLCIEQIKEKINEL